MDFDTYQGERVSYDVTLLNKYLGTNTTQRVDNAIRMGRLAIRKRLTWDGALESVDADGVVDRPARAFVVEHIETQTPLADVHDLRHALVIADEVNRNSVDLDAATVEGINDQLCERPDLVEYLQVAGLCGVAIPFTAFLEMKAFHAAGMTRGQFESVLDCLHGPGTSAASPARPRSGAEN